ncbi:MAG: alpha/beta hydrolase, partial [Sphingobacteriales bacterium]
MKIQEQKITLEQDEIFYLHKSSPKALHTVIFIHGFPFSSAMWRGQLESLPEHIEGFAFDISGFGQSTTGHHFFSVDLFARKLFAFMDGLRISKAILCGLSMGGYITLRALEIDKERVSGVILCDTHSLSDNNEGKLKRFASIDLVTSGRKVEFASSFLKNLFAEESFAKQKPAVELIESI